MKNLLIPVLAVFALVSPVFAQKKTTVCELNKVNKDVEQTIKYVGQRVEVTVLNGSTSSGYALVKDHQFTFNLFDNSCKHPFGNGFTVAWPFNVGVISGEMVKDPITGVTSYDEDGIHRHYSALSTPGISEGLTPVAPTPFTVTGVLEQDEQTGELVLHMDSYTNCWTGGNPRRTECKKHEVTQ